MILDFVKMLSKSLLTNLIKSGIMAAVAYSCTWWMTILIGLILGLYLDDIYQQAIDINKSFMKALYHGIISIPYAFVSMSQCNYESSQEVPLSLQCCIGRELLDDPVYVQGQFMSRNSAMELVRKKSRGPSGDIVELKHVIECPEIQALVRHYKKLYGNCI